MMKRQPLNIVEKISPPPREKRIFNHSAFERFAALKCFIIKSTPDAHVLSIV